MSLFAINSTENLLPFDGILNYYGKILNQAEADKYFGILQQNISWKQDEVILFGKRIMINRMTAWYGDEDFAYTYSHITRHAMKWTTALLEIKKRIEEISGEQFNSCLMNFYHDGKDGMAWHSDNEKTIKENSAIASLSLGAERKISFKHKRTSHNVSIVLKHGSLLLMRGEIQQYWLHALPKSKKIKNPRINLTFRQFQEVSAH